MVARAYPVVRVSRKVLDCQELLDIADRYIACAGINVAKGNLEEARCCRRRAAAVRSIADGEKYLWD